MKNTVRFAVAAGLLGIASLAIAADSSAPDPATTIPENAKDLLPVLSAVVDDAWPEFPKAALAALIETQSCVTLTHAKCWNPKAELKTEREYGFGLGQITVKTENGKEVMNMFEETKKFDPKLASWAWEDRFDAKNQMRALLAHNRELWNQITFAANDEERLAFTLAAFSGGLGHVLKDRKLCEARKKKTCDSTRWFDNVEKDSVKSKTVQKGASASFFEMNRSFVRDVLKVRRTKYEASFVKAAAAPVVEPPKNP